MANPILKEVTVPIPEDGIQPVGRIKGRELGLYHLGRWGQGNPSQRAKNKLHKNCEASKMNAY